jgi:hypothetical protein
MVSTRENRLIIVTGKKRIGKSNETLRNIFYDVVADGRKGLLFDVNNEYGEYEIFFSDGKSKVHRIKRIFHKDIKKFSSQKKIEVCRVVPISDSGKRMTHEQIENLLLKVLNDFRGGVLLLEDMNNLIGDSLPVKVSGALVNNAHRDCDIYVHLQSVGRVLPKMRQNAEYVRFHYQLDGVEDSKGKLKSEYQIFKIAQNLVNKEYFDGNKRFFLFVNREEHKLIGNFKKEQLEVAIKQYITQHQIILKPLLEQRAIGGKKRYSYDECVVLKIKELLKQYN